MSTPTTTRPTAPGSTTPTITADLDNRGSTVSGRFTIKNLPTLDSTDATKPLFAAVGVADYALEQVKDVPAELTAEAKRVLADVPNRVKDLPNQVKSYREDVESRVQSLYAQLAVRGERLVTQIRRQPATEAAIAEGKEAVRKAEAAVIAAKHSAKAGEQAIEDATAKIG